jgi:hypothetical protein
MGEVPGSIPGWSTSIAEEVVMKAPTKEVLKLALQLAARHAGDHSFCGNRDPHTFLLWAEDEIEDREKVRRRKARKAKKVL